MIRPETVMIIHITSLNTQGWSQGGNVDYQFLCLSLPLFFLLLGTSFGRWAKNLAVYSVP